MARVTFALECGDRVRDRVTGLEGVVTALSYYLNTCRRVVVQPPVGADPTKIPDAYALDESQVERVVGGGDGTTVDFKWACGDRVRDRVSGLEGTVTMLTRYQNGCLHVLVQPMVEARKLGTLPEPQYFDEERLDALPVAAAVLPRKDTGGPPTRVPAVAARSDRR